jgi:hypothetical protein
VRTVEGRTYIQTTAAISPGSSGGALLDSSGRVIGVTTAQASGAQNLNLALPINMLKDFKAESLTTLQSILPDTIYYADHYPAPDFGAFAGIRAFQSEASALSASYYYRVNDLPKSVDQTLGGYSDLLEDNTFQVYGYAIENGRIITYYTNSAYGILLTVGIVKFDDTDCIRIQIM